MEPQSSATVVPEEINELCYHTQNGVRIPVFPYVVAVSGHRKFADASCTNPRGFDESTIKEAFQRELKGLAEKWRQTSKSVAPFVLLTGLADGADQLAAEAALELDEQLNVKVAAVLPMERDIFRLTVDNKERFDELMGQVHYSFALPVDPVTVEEGRVGELKLVDNPKTEDTRQRQYVRLAKFLAVHSHVLFVLWDGINDQSPGGTANVVRIKLQGSDDGNQENFLTYSSVGPVVHLLTPRDNAANRNEPFDAKLSFDKIPVFLWTRDNLWKTDNTGHIFPSREIMMESRRLTQLASSMSEIADVLKKQGQLNVDAVKFNAKATATFDYESQESFLGGQRSAIDNLDAGSQLLLDHFLVASRVALLFQKKSQTIGKWFVRKGKNVNGYPFWVAALCFFGGLFAFFWNIYDKGWCQTAAGDWAYPTIIWLVRAGYWGIASYIGFLVWKATRDKYHYRYFRSRAVAEALRVQVFWRVAGLNDCVSAYYRSHQIQDSEWLRATINGLDVFLPGPEPFYFKNSPKERLVFVRDRWIKGQLSYFKDGIVKRRKNDAQRWWENRWFTVALFILIMGFGPMQDQIFLKLYNLCPNKSSCLLGIGFYCVAISLVTAFFLYHSIKKRLMCQKQEADRYERMIFPYDRAELLTMRNGNPTNDESIQYWRQIFRQLGAEAIAENADWLLTVGERDLTLPR